MFWAQMAPNMDKFGHKEEVETFQRGSYSTAKTREENRFGTLSKFIDVSV